MLLVIFCQQQQAQFVTAATSTYVLFEGESVPDKVDLSKLFSGFVFFQQVHRFCKSSNWNYRLGWWKVLNRVFQEVFPRRIFLQRFPRRFFPQSSEEGSQKRF